MSKGFIVTILMIFLLFAVPFGYKDAGIGKEFKAHVKDIESMTDHNLKFTHVQFGFTWGENTIGQCNTTFKTITINKEYWDHADYRSQILLLVHEQLHCQFNAKHAEDWGDGFCPKSIMYPKDTGRWCNQIKFIDYIEEAAKWE